MLKTPLPEKIKLEFTNGDLITSINQIIDVLTELTEQTDNVIIENPDGQLHSVPRFVAELTEVVEGKQDNFYSKSVATYEREHNQKIDGAKVFCEHLKNTPTPTLKEQLLVAMVAKARYSPEDKEFKVSLPDIEAIINRLIK
jgi:hypothetical protein